MPQGSVEEKRELADELSQRLTEAHERCPGVSLTVDELCDELTALAASQAEPHEWIRAAPLADLLLARACARGDEAALRLFEERFAASIGATLGRIGLDSAQADDAAQSARERLFVAPAGGGDPKIASYAGRGSLAGWLKVLVSRLALESRRSAQRDAATEDDELEDLWSAADGPDLAAVRREHRRDFKAAFEEAVGALAAEQRLLLAQYYLDRLTIDDLGALYQVHRVTAARRLARARLAILEGVRSRLQARLELGDAEIDDVVRSIRSRIDLSLSRLLRRADAAKVPEPS